MPPSSASGAPDPLPAPPNEAQPPGTTNGTTQSSTESSIEGAPDSTIDTATLLLQLGEDRLWLLQQIDAGHWPDLRLDLAALERELGLLLEQARQKFEGP